jgi:hypothetical protein
LSPKVPQVVGGKLHVIWKNARVKVAVKLLQPK